MGNSNTVPFCSPNQEKHDSNMMHARSKDQDEGSEKVLYCVRHAESESNKKRWNLSTYFTAEFYAKGHFMDPNIKDPEISDKGHTQIARLHTKLERMNFVSTYHIEVCFTSPFSRAIDTALGVFANHSPAVAIIVVPELRPHFKSSQSTGTLTTSALKEKYKMHTNIDFEYLEHEIWWNPTNDDAEEEKETEITYDEDSSCDDEKLWQQTYGDKSEHLRYESAEEFASRQTRLKALLAARPEHAMILVGHCGFFRNLLGIWSYVGNCGMIEAHFDSKTRTITHSAFF